MFFSAAPVLAPALVEEIIELEVLQLTQLTRRELQILELVSRGLQNKTIATQLHLSEFTVKIHLHNIITKLGAHNRTEAAAFFRDSQPAPVSHLLA
jgi:DNA-binding NarL/FixJ family response regulator